LIDLSKNGAVKFSADIIEDRKEAFTTISEHIYYVRKNMKELENILNRSESMGLETKTAFFFSDLKPHMEHIRRHVDALENIMPDSIWHLPKYREMLFIS